MDECTRKCLASFAARKIRAQDAILILVDLFLQHGVSEYIRSDNGPEFIAIKLRKWFKTLGVEPLFIETGSPWENGSIESFNGRLRDQFLYGEMLYSLKDAKIMIEKWRIHYNTVRPHSSLDGVPPVPETIRLLG